MMSTVAPGLLTGLLRQVSRSFYLTLRVLPPAVRPQIGLAYLLARTTDTVADTEVLDAPRRLEALRALQDRIQGATSAPLEFEAFVRSQSSSAERVLLERSEEALAALENLGVDDRALIRQVLGVITGGQALDLQRFHGAGRGRILALRDDAELRDYTYRVAGCVGEFWTRLCRRHVFPGAVLNDDDLVGKSVLFGQGLQLVNILRDLPRDLQQGRCYLPADRLEKAGLVPADLLLSASEPRVRPLYDEYLDLAEGWLGSGWDYTNALPWRCARVRLACAWPVLIGVRTLRRLRVGPILDPGCRIRVSRGEVRSILLGTLLRYPFRSAWTAQFWRGR
jgi:farnesyl-diphosphate farnesyltransferase